ncbi:hypothetical protein SAMN06265365_105233 [Tistlia consotensis]|uniref:3-dehydroquinate dehydratase n=1 Tax=Tistlia consotensis USBA 355 TaxID=560819 RepID=A0A1Y6BJ17_9PROT|nr:hypothetical protein [Tistlia consotensis]SMF12135.1 hypothetical protein SAMN05428998_10565 [Tistlia consotensis USBA 355]SNR51332.1 hypothetical protein SAMN06265365_105233 [Tistlia consotensis]
MSEAAYVVNGPDPELPGQRQPDIHGRETLRDVVDWIHEARRRS